MAKLIKRILSIGGITLLLAIFTALGTWFWNLRTSQIEDLQNQITTYEKSEKWKLPETLEKINLASQKIELNLTQRNRLEFLEKNIIELTTSNSELGKTLEETQEKLQKNTEALNKVAMKNDEFLIERSSSHPLVNNNIYISVKSVGLDYVSGLIDNHEYRIDVGQSVQYHFGTIICNVVATKVSYRDDTATFKRSCQEKQ